eukprot:GHVO01010488.1.p1 GENE.GHVO01010488.1~~GHVO01010488.1.p1  ORF type:complete len:349 (+),score=73.20 GHVO01010488.1:1249-2295(+)
MLVLEAFSKILKKDEPTVTVADDAPTITEWVAENISETVHAIGFDTETAVRYPRPHRPPVPCLVQIATHASVLIVRLKHDKPPQQPKVSLHMKLQALEALLLNGSESPIKAGFEMDREEDHIHRGYGIAISNYVNLTPAIRGMSKAMLDLFSVEYNKDFVAHVRCSNWEIPELSDEQISYAACDAWLSLLIYDELSAKRSSPLDRRVPNVIVYHRSSEETTGWESPAEPDEPPPPKKTKNKCNRKKKKKKKAIDSNTTTYVVPNLSQPIHRLSDADNRPLWDEQVKICDMDPCLYIGPVSVPEHTIDENMQTCHRGSGANRSIKPVNTTNQKWKVKKTKRETAAVGQW